MLDLHPATREVARLLEGVTDDQLSAPSPSDCDVATLLDHLMGLTLAFTWAAEKATPPEASGAPAPSGANVDPDWRSVLPGRLDALADAWSKPLAWDGMTEAGGVALPGEVAALVALDEVVLHGWDLAQGSGRPLRVSDEVVDYVRGLAESVVPPGRSRGAFGDEVAPPGDASPLDRLAAFAGRSPVGASDAPTHPAVAKESHP